MDPAWQVPILLVDGYARRMCITAGGLTALGGKCGISRMYIATACGFLICAHVALALWLGLATEDGDATCWPLDGRANFFDLWHVLGSFNYKLRNCSIWKSTDSVVVKCHVGKDRADFLAVLHQEAVSLALDDQHLRSADVVCRLAKENHQSVSECRLVGQHLLIAWGWLSDEHRVASRAFVDFIVGPSAKKQLSGDESR